METDIGGYLSACGRLDIGRYQFPIQNFAWIKRGEIAGKAVVRPFRF